MRMARRFGIHGGMKDLYIFNGAVISPYTWTTDRKSPGTVSINTTAHPGVIYLYAPNNSAYPYAEASMQYTINARPYNKLNVSVTAYQATEGGGVRYRPTIWASDGDGNEVMLDRDYAPSIWTLDITSWEQFGKIRLRAPDGTNKGTSYTAVILAVNKIWLSRE